MSERAGTIRSGDLALEGRLHLPDGGGPFAGVAVCHPHPQYGGDMHNNVVGVLCQALVARGIAALRFNFRGTGGSGGAHDGGRGEREDVVAALAYLADQGEIDAARLGLAGYSFGAMMALLAAGPLLRALALVSTPVRALDRERLEGLSGALLLVSGDSDPVSPEGPFREVAEALARPAEVRLVGGADHSWWGYERDLDEIVGPFFLQHLSKTGGG